MTTARLCVARFHPICFSTVLIGSIFTCWGCGGGDKPASKSEVEPVTPTTQLEAACADGVDDDADGTVDCSDTDCQSPGGECIAAPPLDRTVATTVGESAAYLYSGSNPLQKSADPKAFEPRRVALLRGRTLDAQGKPLAGVKISIKGHPEYGHTYSRGDGLFDMAVNGGARLRLHYERDGYLPVERGAHPGWQRYLTLPDAGLVVASTKTTTVNSNATEVQMIVGDAVEGEFGKHAPLVVIEPNTAATAVLPSGDQAPLASLTVGVTEYPIDRAQRYLPGDPIAAGGLVYGLEFAVKEADALGARHVAFSTPVSVYVENLAGLETGKRLSVEHFDRPLGQWETGVEGQVIELLSVVDGVAQIDTDGDRAADDESALMQRGITESDRKALGARYPAGQRLWHAEMRHFSAGTIQAKGTPPTGAASPVRRGLVVKTLDNPTYRGRMAVEAQASTHDESVIGTPYTLHYQSNRTLSYAVGRQLEVPIFGAVVPAGLKKVKSVITVANRTFEEEYTSLSPELRQVVMWDGRDGAGRLTQGQQVASVQITYYYTDAKSPGLEAILPVSFEVPLSNWDARALGLGGFSLAVHHSYDPAQQIVYYGNGTQRSGQNVSLVTKPASVDDAFDLGTPDSLVAVSDGSLIVTDDQQFSADTFGRILRIGSDGTPSVLFGEGATGAAAQVLLSQPQAVLVKGDGTLIASDIAESRIVEIAPDTTLTTLVSGYSEDSPMVLQALNHPDGMALGPREELYFVDADRVYRYEAGQVTVVAGGGTETANDGMAKDALLVVPSGLLLDRAGYLYVSERGMEGKPGGHRVRRISPSGDITTLAGTGMPGYSGDGDVAKSAQLNDPHGLAMDPKGRLFIVDQNNGRIRRISEDGFIQTVIGGGTELLSAGSMAVNVKLDTPDGIAAGPDGSLYIAMKGQVFRAFVGLPNIASTDNLVPSRDGSTLYHFDQRGRHLKTIDVVTGITLLAFDYDAQTNLLQSITDVDGNKTTIRRAGTNQVTITGQYGQETTLDLADGDVAKITDPVKRTTTITWDAQKLATRVDDPKEGPTLYGYDPAGTGRLTNVKDATGYEETLKRSDINNGWQVDVTATEKQRTTSYATMLATDIWTRTRTEADQSTRVLEDRGYLVTFIAADGTQYQINYGMDLSFGSQAMAPTEQTVQLPSGKSLTTEMMLNGRKLKDIYNPLDFDEWTDMVTSNGREYLAKYDRATRTWTRQSPMGRTSETTLDERTHPIRLASAGIPTTALAYDAGRIKTMTQTADNSSRTSNYGYDAQGWPASFTNGLGEQTGFEYDIAGRLRKLVRPDQELTLWELNNTNQVTSLTPPGRPAHVFDYDATTKLLGDITPPAVAKEDGTPGAGVVTFDYNPKAHELTKITRADGRSIEFEYDAVHRVTAQKFGTASINFSYTGGHLTRIDRTDGVTVGQTFDGSLWMSTKWSGGVSGSVKAAYDANLWLSSLTVNDQSTVSFSYDSDGLLTAATSTVGGITLTRDAQTGNITATTLGNTTSKHAYSGYAELMHTSDAYSGATLFEQNVVDRDALGRITHLTEVVQGTLHDVTYGYDTVGRLTKQTRDGVTKTYGYDANGNRTSLSVAGAAPIVGTYDAQDRIQTYGTVTYKHDDHGDLKLKTDGTKSLAARYDELGNLMQATVTDGGTTKVVKYVVDGLGRRVGRQVNGAFDRAWLYRDSLRPIAEIDSAGVFTHFVYASHSELSGAPDAMIRGGVFYRIVKDHLGSVRLVINAETGAIAQSVDYDAFGRVLSETGAGFQPFGFAGGLYDAATGLVRFGARDYDAETGRWTNKDPIGFAGQQGNVYLYVGGDPVNGVDPEGRRPLIGREEAFLTAVFGKSLDISKIDLDAGLWDDAGYQVFDNEIRLPRSFFRNGNTDCGLNLSDSRVASWFAHEAFHLWQRQRGVWVTALGAPLALLRIAGLHNPYKYRLDKSPDANLTQFLQASLEVQAAMLEHGIMAMLEGNAKRLSKYWDIIEYVRTH